MIDLNRLPYVRMSVALFDRTLENPLPLGRKSLLLDWGKLSDEEIVDAFRILNVQSSKFSPNGFDETLITLSIGGAQSKSEMIKYRKAFIEFSETEFEERRSFLANFRIGGHILSAPHEYVEDENGTQISMHDIIAHMTGNESVVLAGDPGSVLRLGKTAPTSESGWTVEKANTVAQFLDVVERLYHSEWYRCGPSITSLSRTTGKSEMLEAIFPDHIQTVSVLAYFRQLHAGDKLLVKSCDVYLDHVGSESKRCWIDYEKQIFKANIDSAPVGPGAGKITATRREILQMFMYGGGLLHSTSNDGSDRRLASLIEQLGKHEAVFLFNSCLWDIYRSAQNVYHVIKQDFDYWITEKGFAAPTRLEIPDLFSGFELPTKDE